MKNYALTLIETSNLKKNNSKKWLTAEETNTSWRLKKP
jgi:hypothetical protein